MGNPRQGVYFGAVPPDVREEYPEQTATALAYTYLSLSFSTNRSAFSS